ncbi:mitochondrial carrier domain-containing protein [Vararia minispora EC-137]|uniref:Mitochondrial carrier domain-containing protein n=1 Tax=Vararia minispora EC-137 TaxID=1314806 RepID=A0ACB8QY57_9AGAM|nr:mitochondrial carrier domain-containing protein [Vararia minispora EC-137]
MPSDSAIHSVAGAAGGIVAMAATYPLIFLSTRAAVETRSENKTTYEAIRDIISREGVVGLYDGLSSSLLGIAVTNGVYYYFYERSKAALVSSRTGSKGLSTLESIIAGVVAGSATTIISNPIWVVQTSQAVQTMSSRPSASTEASTSSSIPTVVRKMNSLETVAHLLRTDGIGAFWRGVGPALVLVMNPVLQYTVFEQLKNTLIRRRKVRGVSGVLTDFDFFILGALSKLVATSVTYPYIVVKSRLQAGQEKARRYASAFDGLRTIVEEEGIKGLYKGISSKLLQSVLTAAILFASQRRIYELTKALTGLAKDELPALVCIRMGEVAVWACLTWRCAER